MFRSGKFNTVTPIKRNKHAAAKLNDVSDQKKIFAGLAIFDVLLPKIHFLKKSRCDMIFPTIGCYNKNHFMKKSMVDMPFHRIEWHIKIRFLQKLIAGIVISLYRMSYYQKSTFWNKLNQAMPFTIIRCLTTKNPLFEKIIAGFAIFQNWVPHKHFLKNLMQAMQFPRIEWLKTKSTFLKE